MRSLHVACMRIRQLRCYEARSTPDTNSCNVCWLECCEFTHKASAGSTSCNFELALALICQRSASWCTQAHVLAGIRSCSMNQSIPTCTSCISPTRCRAQRECDHQWSLCTKSRCSHGTLPFWLTTRQIYSVTRMSEPAIEQHL
jgi:hypothetical protein